MIIRSITSYSSDHIWTNVLGLSRTLLALGTTVTLIFNSNSDLFLKGASCDYLNISIFCLLDQHLTFAKVLSCLILVICIYGWRPRFMCIPHWWISYSFMNSASTIDGGDHITAILTLLLIPVCLSDSRLSHWDSIEVKYKSTIALISTIIAKHTLVVIKIQVAIVYLHAAIAKTGVSQWMDGTALYYWFTHPVFGANEYVKPLVTIIIYDDFLSAYLTWGIMIFEILLVSGIFMSRKYKVIFFVIGLLFHFGIFIIHGLFTFFLTMSAALSLLLISDFNFKINQGRIKLLSA